MTPRINIENEKGLPAQNTGLGSIRTWVQPILRHGGLQPSRAGLLTLLLLSLTNCQWSSRSYGTSENSLLFSFAYVLVKRISEEVESSMIFCFFPTMTSWKMPFRFFVRLVDSHETTCRRSQQSSKHWPIK